MSKLHQIKVNAEEFSARSGQLILDAALLAGVELPHDCRAGRCGACLTRVVRGITLGGESLQSGMVHACQARVFSSLELAVEVLPPAGVWGAWVVDIVDVTADVAEVVLKLEEPFDRLPGQYCRFTFRGFPPRAYSPTAPLDGHRRTGRIHLNIKRVRDGRVSSKLARDIRSGHRVAIEGPFGHAFLRPAHAGRLVLVGSGTGFAPMWDVATAALSEDPEREVVLIAGIRSLASCYMIRALEHASNFPNVQIVVSASEPHPAVPELRSGLPSDHLPQLRPSDIVFAAGAPSIVAEVGLRANEAQCQFYSDPFEPAFAVPENWFSKAVNWLGAY